MKYLNSDQISKYLPYAELINALREGFKEGGNVPLRHAHTVPTNGADNTLLMMPSWQQGSMLGVKLVMVCPDNNLKNMEAVSSTYMLFDAVTGERLAMLDGDELTVRRTACASALASSYLSSKNAKSMLMMGTGKLAPHLIRAHSAVRPLEEVFIWGRRFEKAKEMAAELDQELDATVTAVETPEEKAGHCDIITCATVTNEPVLLGRWLSNDKKQHVDLVGGFTRNMREADNDVIKNVKSYVDTRDGAFAEAGDIVQPIEQGIISQDDIGGDLYDMANGKVDATGDNTSTLFKSVGTALEDLVAAKLAFEKSD